MEVVSGGVLSEPLSRSFSWACIRDPTQCPSHSNCLFGMQFRKSVKLCSNLLFKKYFNVIGVQLIYNIVLVLGVQQSDSGIHRHRITLLDFFVMQVITEYWIEFPVLYSRSPSVISLIYSGVFATQPPVTLLFFLSLLPLSISHPYLLFPSPFFPSFLSLFISTPPPLVWEIQKLLIFKLDFNQLELCL